MQDLLNFTAHTLHTAALIAMGVIYTARLIWLFKRFKAGKERQPTTGNPANNSKRKSIMYSWMVVAMPWAMESQRRNLIFWCTFVLFHVGIAAAITQSVFVLPYFPELFSYEFIRIGMQILIGASFVIGLIRVVRRFASKYIRAISTPDDYFSIIILTIWFGFAFFAVPNTWSNEPWHLVTFFIMTSFLLVYVPFSKISHYLYYPFTRYYMGKTMGHRGVYPMKNGHSVGS